mmetsp:Transcript_12760/g.21022  ORF Transcript_12760/g.21022 Transcript_12760/m.21022 type:complete len:80 (-) Transcript_12760:66-305(-)
MGIGEETFFLGKDCRGSLLEDILLELLLKALKAALCDCFFLGRPPSSGVLDIRLLVSSEISQNGGMVLGCAALTKNYDS